jgi:hypothetical protein
MLKPALEVSPVYLFNPTDHTILQPDFNAMGVGWGFCQDVFDNSFCQFSGALILL